MYKGNMDGLALTNYFALVAILGWLNTIGRTCVSNYDINKHALMMTITKFGPGNLNFNPLFFGRCFVLDLLMHHEICCVELIGRSWRTWKTNQITPTDLPYFMLALTEGCAVSASCTFENWRKSIQVTLDFGRCFCPVTAAANLPALCEWVVDMFTFRLTFGAAEWHQLIN